MAAAALTGTDKHSQARAIRSTLDAAADLINTQHAAVLSAVIAMQEQHLHRTAFGFSALRDLLLSQFDFTYNTASSIAAIARLSRKFQILAQAATSGQARIDQIAYALRQLDKTPAMRLFARTPFRAPVASPFDASVTCPTPEHLIAQYCAHAPFKDLQRHLDDLAANLAEETALLASLGEQSLQWITIAETGNGMWHLSGELSNETGRLLDKYLKTASPPPRQDETDADGALPAAPNRHAEALHQLLAGYGTSSEAVKRHGHTATLDLTVDIETLQGKDTGRLPLLEGKPISVAKARLLACEAGIIPSVFNYQSGEAIELGRTMRLPNAALRRKLELEQPQGCAWHGCDRPVSWTEAHHLQHWADGGKTTAENLILLCRFHHGRIHTTGWSVEKTGPGQAIITHHDHPDTTATPACATLDTTVNADATGSGSATGGGGCGCADWRTDADLDAEHQDSDWDAFPTGLYRTEWAPTMKPDLDARAEAAEQAKRLAAIRAAKAKCRERFAQQPEAEVPGPQSTETTDLAMDLGDPPFLPCPFRWRLGRGTEGTSPMPSSPNPNGDRALRRARWRQQLEPSAGKPTADRQGTKPFSSPPVRTATTAAPEAEEPARADPYLVVAAQKTATESHPEAENEPPGVQTPLSPPT